MGLKEVYPFPILYDIRIINIHIIFEMCKKESYLFFTPARNLLIAST